MKFNSGAGREAPISGDGFVTLDDGTVRWGRFGAAGVLVRCAAGGNADGGEGGEGGDGGWWYFLARRSEWCHQGGCWAIPGGALSHGESPVEGAVREFVEEVGEVLGDFTVAEIYEDDHGGWSYWTIVVDVAERFAPAALVNWETAETDWFPQDRLGELELHTAFRRTLVRLGFLEERGA